MELAESLRRGALSVAAAGLMGAVVTNALILSGPRSTRLPTAAEQMPEGVPWARRSLELALLSSEPLAVLGFDAERSKSLLKARAFFNEAYRRNPRFEEARVWLLLQDLELGRYDSAMAHIERILVLDLTSQQQMLALLAGLAQIPAARSALLTLLRKDPPWRPNLFYVMAARDTPVSIMISLLESSSGLQAGDALEEKRMILGELLDRGNFTAAADLRLRFLPNVARASHVFDPTFKRLPGPRPFSWKLSTGSAAFRDGGGLQIQFLTSSGGRFAEQTLLLRPGRYRLGSDGQSVPRGRLGWQVTCADGGKLAEVPLGRSNLFEVPNHGCAAQTLVLLAEPTEASEFASVEVQRVSLASTDAEN